MFKRMSVPILGLVENMTAFACPHCGELTEIFGRGGGERFAAEHGIDYLGGMPLDVTVRQGGDVGVPAVAQREPGPAARALTSVAGAVAARMSVRAARPPTRPVLDRLLTVRGVTPTHGLDCSSERAGDEGIGPTVRCGACGATGAVGARFCDQCGGVVRSGRARREEPDAASPTTTATGGSSPPCSPTSSTTSGWSPSTIPRRSGDASRAALARDGRRDRAARRHPREVHRGCGVRGLRLAARPRRRCRPRRPRRPRDPRRRCATAATAPRRWRSGSASPPARSSRSRADPARRRPGADRRGDHDRGPDPVARPAGRDPARRGHACAPPAAGWPSTDRGSVVLRGQSSPVRLLRARGRGRARRLDDRTADRLVGPLVGRARGASTRSGAPGSSAARPGRRRHRCSWSATPGIGKTRLARRPRGRARGARASPGPGPTTSRTAATSRIGSAASVRPGRRRRARRRFGHDRAPLLFTRRPADPTRCGGTAAPSPPSPGTPPSRAGRRRRRTCRPTRVEVAATLMEVADPLRRAAHRRSTGRGSWSSTTCTGSIRRASAMVEMLVEHGDPPSARRCWPASGRAPLAGLGAPAGRRAHRPARVCEPETARLATLVARAAVDADGRAASTSGPVATRCSSPRRCGRTSRTGRSPGATAG